MESGFKKGAMVMLLRSSEPLTKKFVGSFRILGNPVTAWQSRHWSFDPPLFADNGFEVIWVPEDMRVIEPDAGTDETLTYAGKPAPVTKRLTEEQFNEACDRWIQGVEA